MNKKDNIRNNLHHIYENIETTCNKLKTNKESVQLMAVTKSVEAEDICIAYEEGVHLFGENYIQPSIQKLTPLFNKTNLQRKHFHFIGHLQSNKLKKAMQYFSTLGAVDSLNLVEKIDHKSSLTQEITPIYLEVNTSNEPAKYGFSPENLLLFIDKIVLFKYIRFIGLMTMGPLGGSEKEIRSSFALLRGLKEAIEHKLNIKGLLLSMGMSNDYMLAIMEGSNMVRIGRGIFGEESVNK